MEELLSIVGVFAGLGAVVFEIAKEIRVSVKSRSIEVRFGDRKDENELKIENIENLSSKEISELIGKLEKFQKNDAGGVGS